MLIGYGEIEFELASLIEAVYREQGPRLGLKTMFRLRSEGQRLDVADGLLRSRLSQDGYAKEYQQAYEAIKGSKQIRNTLSHTHWMIDYGKLAYYNLETSAKSQDDTDKLMVSIVDDALLLKQLAYFNYTRYCLIFLQQQYEYFDGMMGGNKLDMPKKMHRPPFHIRQKEYVGPIPEEEPDTPPQEPPDKQE